MKLIQFTKLATRYKTIFFDSYGVLRNYNGIINEVENALNFLHQQNIQYFILTNDASRSPEQLISSFHNLGLTCINDSQIISSGMLAAEYLDHKINKGKVVYFGTENCAHYIKSVGLDPLSIDEFDLSNCKEIQALVFMDDEGFNWNTAINKALNLLQQTNITAICANTDYIYPIKGGQSAVAIGALAKMMESLSNKKFLHYGKPDSQMFNYAFNHAQKFNNCKKNQILMVGDTLQTDIMGANKFGIDSLLVLTGNTPKEKAHEHIKNWGINPDFICNDLS